MKIAIFASGTGSNFERLAQAFAAGEIAGELALLVCDHPTAPVVEKAKRAGVAVATFTVKSCGGKAAFEEKILATLKHYHIDLIALAGYMRVIGPTILDAYPHRIINLHPAYLPEYQGLHAIERAFADHETAGKDYTGVTLHYVDAGLDTGPIIRQQKVPIKPTDTLATLEARIHAVEHELYPQVLAAVVQKAMKPSRHN